MSSSRAGLHRKRPTVSRFHAAAAAFLVLFEPHQLTRHRFGPACSTGQTYSCVVVVYGHGRCIQCCWLAWQTAAVVARRWLECVPAGQACREGRGKASTSDGRLPSRCCYRGYISSSDCILRQSAIGNAQACFAQVHWPRAASPCSQWSQAGRSSGPPHTPAPRALDLECQTVPQAQAASTGNPLAPSLLSLAHSLLVWSATLIPAPPLLPGTATQRLLTWHISCIKPPQMARRVPAGQGVQAAAPCSSAYEPGLHSCSRTRGPKKGQGTSQSMIPSKQKRLIAPCCNC